MDVVNDSKGKESIYTHFEDKFEVMFHVSTLLPFHPADPLKVFLSLCVCVCVCVFVVSLLCASW